MTDLTKEEQQAREAWENHALKAASIYQSSIHSKWELYQLANKEGRNDFQARLLEELEKMAADVDISSERWNPTLAGTYARIIELVKTLKP